MISMCMAVFSIVASVLAPSYLFHPIVMVAGRIYERLHKRESKFSTHLVFTLTSRSHLVHIHAYVHTQTLVMPFGNMFESGLFFSFFARSVV